MIKCRTSNPNYQKLDNFFDDKQTDEPMTASQVLANQGINFSNVIKPVKRLRK